VIVGPLMYLISLPWKLLFATTAPPSLCGGWACFFHSLVYIGLLTALIGDLANHLGCSLGITASVTAITFVALGTSLPDTFASMSSAKSEPYADNSIGNVTGSNSVNVFLGLGLPWAVASVYWGLANLSESTKAAWHERYSGESWYTPGMKIAFAVPAGDLAFSVSVFSFTAIICLMVLTARRAFFGAELGGPGFWKRSSAAFLVLLWFFYIAASVAGTYGYISTDVASYFGM